MTTKKTLMRIGVISLATVVTLFYVWTRLQNIRLNRELKRLKIAEQKANLENGKLHLKWTQLTATTELEELARNKFNLEHPKPEQIVLISEEKNQK